MALTMRSAPTSDGFSYRIGIPVFVAGSTTRGRRPKYCSTIAHVVPVSGGTTEPRTIPPTCAHVRALCVNSPSTSNPSSSAVRSRSVWSRHAWTSWRSEEHTSELQSLRHLVCRLLLEKKNNIQAHPARDVLAHVHARYFAH